MSRRKELENIIRKSENELDILNLLKYEKRDGLYQIYYCPMASAKRIKIICCKRLDVIDELNHIISAAKNLISELGDEPRD